MAREIRLKERPQGHLKADNFEVAEVSLPPLGEGDILVRNIWMSVDPYMRLVLTGQEGFVPQKQPGDVMDGAAIGIVERSSDPALPAGTAVASAYGWRTHFVAKADTLSILPNSDAPLNWYLSALGLTGITAFLGIEKVLQPRQGETVLISGASGAVGSIACQLAKLRGARVLATCSSEQKARWLRDKVGVDATMDYRQEQLDDFIAREAPEGLDCYFDNVGGEMLDRTLNCMKAYGRIGLCGAISQYESRDYRSGPANFFAAIEKSLTMRGFNAFLLTPEENAEAVNWLAGRADRDEIIIFEKIFQGLEQAPVAFAGLFGGGYEGKVVIKL
ncbi:MAG: NADP-dependent oxidoreductase [Novosphingobium sp.]|nr:NADP-dependent oxidoreductase [Novosphingobium sp.]